MARVRTSGLYTLMSIMLTGSLAGCGLVGVTATTATGAGVELKDAQQAKQTEDQVRQQVEQLTQQHAAQISQGEKDAQ
jgi:hypothetical protein